MSYFYEGLKRFHNNKIELLLSFRSSLEALFTTSGMAGMMTSLAGWSFFQKLGIPRVKDGTVDPGEGVSASVTV